ncbi:MAG TPA: chemotaxis protein CheX [Opitutaceae bacterium]|nr:chemotaxis protein CheX [Opitutaceae bacterium]
MPATQEITETVIRENMNRAVSHVFKTMLSRMPAVSTALEQNADALTPASNGTRHVFQLHVIGTVGFIGEANGLIYLYIPLPLARLCARNLLGMTERELDEAGEETVNDAIGELTNIMIGSFKSGLCDAGYACMLTMPSLLRGDNFCSESGGSIPRHVYAFECAGHRLVAEILLKIGD